MRSYRRYRPTLHSEDAVTALIDAMRAAGDDWDGEIVLNMKRSVTPKRRVMLATGKAQKCY